MKRIFFFFFSPTPLHTQKSTRSKIVLKQRSAKMIRACLLVLLSLQAALAVTYSACGASSTTNFQTWTGSFTTTTPVVYPASEAELKTLVLDVAKLPGCKIRVVGTAGSADGLVQQKHETNIVVVNLANMAPNSDWNGQIDTKKNVVRMAAGRTLLDLMSVIRPQGYVLSTRSYGRYFTLGGFFMNPGTHGATFGADRAAKLVTGVRVLLSSGKYVEITNPVEIQAWRGSFGLLGIVTGKLSCEFTTADAASTHPRLKYIC